MHQDVRIVITKAGGGFTRFGPWELSNFAALPTSSEELTNEQQDVSALSYGRKTLIDRFPTVMFCRYRPYAIRRVLVFIVHKHE